jgi:hypothetical protein
MKGVDFPSAAATEQQDLPPLGEEENCRLCCRIRKTCEKASISFSIGQIFCKKEAARQRSGPNVGPIMQPGS